MVKRIEATNGTIIYLNDHSCVYNREDGPAVILSDGTEYWYKNDELHREDGPAVIYPDGSKFWYKNGKRHREDGPAVIYSDGREIWYKNGLYHRADGPAVIRPDGTELWFLNGDRYSFNEWLQVLNITDEEKMELILRYG